LTKGQLAVSLSLRVSPIILYQDFAPLSLYEHRMPPKRSLSSSRRRSSRNSLTELAQDIALYRKNVVVMTGAGVSIASGVRPFRGADGVWTEHLWTSATREAFRKNPQAWYQDFWLPEFGQVTQSVEPNAAHHALSELCRQYSNLNLITQNVDGLHAQVPDDQKVEAHGRLGLFKCLPEEDSDTDSDSDDDEDRLVHLGHRRKRRLDKRHCPYQMVQSLTVDQVEPPTVRPVLKEGKGKLLATPKCPSCRNPLAPQALLFDEGYHSHDFYQFRRMEDWLSSADVLVFCGTSFAVRLPEVALEQARDRQLPVYNINPYDTLEATARLNVTNIKEPSELVLPKLWDMVQALGEVRTPSTVKRARGEIVVEA